MGKKILLVDDENDILELYQKIIEKGGYDVQAADNGFDALKIVKKNPPDLVILDVMMPEMNGWQVAKRIRKEHDGLPIIMLTVKGEIEDKMKSIEEAGANRHLTKPMEVPLLLDTIKSLLNEI